MSTNLLPNPATTATPQTLGLSLNITGTLPGEALLEELTKYAGIVRNTMAPALRDRLDAILVQQAEDLQKVWRGMFVRAGILAE
jgi:hypothetical protein